MNNRHYLTVDNGRVRIDLRLKRAIDRIDRDRDEIERHPHPTAFNNKYISKTNFPIAKQK